jgi:hypothetical protein
MQKRVIATFILVLLILSVLHTSFPEHEFLVTTATAQSESANFTLMWTSQDLYIDSYDMNPLCLDVNKDGYMDIIQAGAKGDAIPPTYKWGRVVCVSGKNGSLMWMYNLSSPFHIEATRFMESGRAYRGGQWVDLILVPGYYGTVCLYAKNGTLCWTNSEAGNEEHSVIVNVSGTPYAYIAHAGNDANSSCGHIAKCYLSNGTLKTRRDIYYPCHGGLSAGDVNGDKNIEIILTGRGPPGGGCQAFNLNLNGLWQRSDIQCSSLCAVLTDWNGDNVLDVIVADIQNDGSPWASIWILNGVNGNTLKKWTTVTGLETHEQLAVYDLDHDGNLELASCVYSPVNLTDLTTGVVVASLGTGQFNGKGPIYANVVGDSDLEVVCGQERSSVKVYEWTGGDNWALSDTISTTARNCVVQDINGDGFNELIVQGANTSGAGWGAIKAYSTLASAPNPLPKTNNNDYGEYRTRTAVNQYAATNLTIYSYDAITAFRAFPNISMPAKFKTNNIHVETCPGEFAPATFVMKSNYNVTVTLEAQGFSLPADAIDLRVVKCWWQRGNNIYSNIPPTTPPGNRTSLLPELLLKNDSLVQVIGMEDYVFFNGSYHQVSHSGGAYGTNPRWNINDTATLQPIALINNTNKQIWITIHPPTGTAAGEYPGRILIKDGSQTIGIVNLNVTVLPFTLPSNPLSSSIYYTSRYSSTYPKGTLKTYKSTQQLIAEFTNMKNHGITNPNVYQNYTSSASNFQVYMNARVAANISNQRIYYLGFPFRETTDLVKLRSVVNATRDYLYTNYGTTELYFYGPDETNMNTSGCRARVAAVQQCGCKVMNALGSISALGIADVLDHVNLCYGPNFAPYGSTYTWYQSVLPTYHSHGNKVGIYGYPQGGEEKPLVYRTNYGLLLWQYDYDAVMDYAYMEGTGLYWDDWLLGSPNYYKQHVFVYPTRNGVIDTVEFEGYREAMNDIRYMKALTTICQTAKDQGKNVSSIESYVSNLKDWNVTTMKNTDLNKTRDRMISYIWDCYNFTSNDDIRDSLGNTWEPTGTNLVTAFSSLTDNMELWVPAVQFSVTSNLCISHPGIKIHGYGNGTKINFTNACLRSGANAASGSDTIRFKRGLDNILLENFTFSGSGQVEVVLGNNTVLKNIRAEYTTDVSHPSAFRLIIGNWSSNATVSGLQVINCSAYKVAWHGIIINCGLGSGIHDRYEIKNVLIDRCHTKWTGYQWAGRPLPRSNGNWSTGIDVCEMYDGNLTVRNVLVRNCTADYSWESGFHCEEAPRKINLTYEHCTANYNGQKKNWMGVGGATHYCSGFLVQGNTTMLRYCSASYNSRFAVYGPASTTQGVPTVINMSGAANWMGQYYRLYRSTTMNSTTGGHKRNAVDSLNLSVKVTDEMQIYINIVTPKGITVNQSLLLNHSKRNPNGYINYWCNRNFSNGRNNQQDGYGWPAANYGNGTYYYYIYVKGANGTAKSPTKNFSIYPNADVSGDKITNFIDLTSITGARWGEGGSINHFCSQDANGDRIVNYLDLTYVTGPKNWGWIGTV